MRIDPDRLPTDTALLHEVVRELAGELEAREQVIALQAARLERRAHAAPQLRLLLAQLKRLQPGRRAERIDPDQLQLGLPPGPPGRVPFGDRIDGLLTTDGRRAGGGRGRGRRRGDGDGV